MGQRKRILTVILVFIMMVGIFPCMGIVNAEYDVPILNSPYAKGYPNGTFAPDNYITRAEAVELFWNVWNRDNFPSAKGLEFGRYYTDVQEDAWYYDSVMFLYASGRIDGYPDGSFLPNNYITRAEFTKIVAENIYLNQPSVFHDVPEDHWAIGYICWAYKNDHISGYPDGNFRPNDNLTRAEAVTILNRYINWFKGLDPLSIDFSGITIPFTDVPESHWAWQQIMAAAVGFPKN